MFRTTDWSDDDFFNRLTPWEKLGVAPERSHRPPRIRPRRAVRPAAQAVGDLLLSAGVTTSTVARIERDEIEPRMTTLLKLAQALEVDPAELVEG